MKSAFKIFCLFNSDEIFSGILITSTENILQNLVYYSNYFPGSPDDLLARIS